MAFIKNLWCLPFTVLGYCLAWLVEAERGETYQGQTIFYHTENLGHTGARGLTLGRVSILFEDGHPHIKNRWYHCAWGRLWSKWGPILPFLYLGQQAAGYCRKFRGLQAIHWSTELHKAAKLETDLICHDSNEYMATLRDLAIGTQGINEEHPDGETLINMWIQRYAYYDDTQIERLRLKWSKKYLTR